MLSLIYEQFFDLPWFFNTIRSSWTPHFLYSDKLKPTLRAMICLAGDREAFSRLESAGSSGHFIDLMVTLYFSNASVSKIKLST